MSTKPTFNKPWIANDGTPIYRPILCLDFDGTMTIYQAGWEGATIISDPPVDGLFEALYLYAEHFEIYIFSSRSGFEGAIDAMRNWVCEWHDKYIESLDEEEKPTRDLINEIVYAEEKPPAFVSLDDRVITFVGLWPPVHELLNFKPWNKI